ncbi:MAG: polysaccharide deacetylase family protein [bacterium]
MASLIPTGVPKVIQKNWNSLTWNIETTKKELYLTFDDGPIPEVTTWVLEQLASFDAKATFFCIGDNVTKHPDIFQSIIDQGHAIGNHTHNHLKAWHHRSEEYLENILRADKALIENTRQAVEFNSKLFRPPYGQMTPKLANKIQTDLGKKVIMWSILSKDYSAKVTPNSCTKNVISKATKGSIVVFHDSLKAFKNLKVALPETLAYFSKKGYTFKRIPALD